MSENEGKNKRRPLKNLPPDRFQPKLWLFWLALAAILILVLKLGPGRMTAPATLKIQEVIDCAVADKIAEGTIRPDPSVGRDWYALTGEMKEATLVGENGKTKSFRAAGILTFNNVEILQKSKVFTEQAATNMRTQIVTQVLPLVIVIEPV